MSGEAWGQLAAEPAELEHETKFLLPASRVAPARALLAGVCRREKLFPSSRVSTLYFDTRELDLAGEKWSSDYLKRKVRLRWYDGRGPVFLEVKRRVGTRREKLRCRLPLDAAELEAGDLATARRQEIVTALARLDPRAPAALEPTLRLAYRRERFVELASGSRLNLDSELVALALAPWCAETGAVAAPQGRLDSAVVELKGRSRDLPPALSVLAALGARRGSSSKYTVCLSVGLS